MERDRDFSKLYHIIVDSGILARMSRQDIKVYLVLLRFGGYQDGISKPTVKKISKLSGINKNDIKKAVDRLEAMGLVLTRKTGKNFSFRKLYGVVRRQWVEPDVALSTIPRNKEECRGVLRGKNGKFISIPKDTEKHASVISVGCNPVGVEDAYPVNSECSTVPKDTAEKETIRDKNRDTCLEVEPVGSTSANSGKMHPVSKLTAFAREHGFREAMKLQKSEGPSSATDDFNKEQERKTAEARRYFGRDIDSKT